MYVVLLNVHLFLFQNTLDGGTCINGHHEDDKTGGAVDDRSSLPVPPPPFATPTNLQSSLVSRPFPINVAHFLFQIF